MHARTYIDIVAKHEHEHAGRLQAPSGPNTTPVNEKWMVFPNISLSLLMTLALLPSKQTQTRMELSDGWLASANFWGYFRDLDRYRRPPAVKLM